MIRSLYTALLAATLLTTGCASSSISRQDVSANGRHLVVRTAILPASGQIGDAVGADLARRGIRIVRSWELTELLARLSIKEVEIEHPANLVRLKAEGVDALIWARSTGSIEHPDTVDVRLYSTHNGQSLADFKWKNAFGGLPGSPADMLMRKGLAGAVADIGEELAKGLRN